MGLAAALPCPKDTYKETTHRKTVVVVVVVVLCPCVCVCVCARMVVRLCVGAHPCVLVCVWKGLGTGEGWGELVPAGFTCSTVPFNLEVAVCIGDSDGPPPTG
jgi:hypothetical protein